VREGQEIDSFSLGVQQFSPWAPNIRRLRHVRNVLSTLSGDESPPATYPLERERTDPPREFKPFPSPQQAHNSPPRRRRRRPAWRGSLCGDTFVCWRPSASPSAAAGRPLFGRVPSLITYLRIPSRLLSRVSASSSPLPPRKGKEEEEAERAFLRTLARLAPPADKTHHLPPLLSLPALVRRVSLGRRRRRGLLSPLPSICTGRSDQRMPLLPPR